MKEISLKDKSVEEEEEQVSKEQPELPKEWRYAHNHPKELIIDDPS